MAWNLPGGLGEGKGSSDSCQGRKEQLPSRHLHDYREMFAVGLSPRMGHRSPSGLFS